MVCSYSMWPKLVGKGCVSDVLWSWSCRKKKLITVTELLDSVSCLKLELMKKYFKAALAIDLTKLSAKSSFNYSYFWRKERIQKRITDIFYQSFTKCWSTNYSTILVNEYTIISSIYTRHTVLWMPHKHLLRNCLNQKRRLAVTWHLLFLICSHLLFLICSHLLSD